MHLFKQWVFFLLFVGIFRPLIKRIAAERQREGGMTCGKGPSVESNWGHCSRDYSLCILGAWAKRSPETMGIWFFFCIIKKEYIMITNQSPLPILRFAEGTYGLVWSTEWRVHGSQTAAVMTTQEALITDKRWYELNSLTTTLPDETLHACSECQRESSVCVRNVVIHSNWVMEQCVRHTPRNLSQHFAQIPQTLSVLQCYYPAPERRGREYTLLIIWNG